MRKMTRAELDAMKGVKKPEAAPAPAADPMAPAMQQFQAAVEHAASRMEHAAALIAAAQHPATPEKKLHAVVHRDAEGRMQSVTITVQPQEK